MSPNFAPLTNAIFESSRSDVATPTARVPRLRNIKSAERFADIKGSRAKRVEIKTTDRKSRRTMR
jgi:hypothetical protein